MIVPSKPNILNRKTITDSREEFQMDWFVLPLNHNALGVLDILREEWSKKHVGQIVSWEEFIWCIKNNKQLWIKCDEKAMNLREI